MRFNLLNRAAERPACGEIPPSLMFSGSAEQQAIWRALENSNHHMIVNAVAGSGKCLGVDTPVMMYDGSIRLVQTIQAGESLMGPDSLPRIVQSTSNGRGPLYRIYPIKGDPWVCNADHILTLKGTNKQSGIIRDVSILDLLAETSHRPRVDRDWKLFRVPLDFAPQAVPIDPYVAGLWCGDGSFSAKQSVKFSLGLTKSDCIGYIQNYAESIGYQCPIRVDEANNYFDVSICLYRKGDPTAGLGTNWVREEMFKHFSDEDSRCISSTYLRNTVAVRSALLAGLLDSDGYYGTGCFELTTVYPALRDCILFLARSLGLSAMASEKWVKLKTWESERPYQRINISGDFSRLPLLRHKPTDRVQIKDVLKTGFRIEPIGRGDYYGFTLNGDGRFLLGDFTVTHNTTTALRGAHAIPGASYLAFNKSVQLEIDRLNLIPSRTFHSIGLEALRNSFFSIKTDLKRGWQIVNSVVPASDGELASSVKQLTSLAKQYGAGRDTLGDLIDMHEVDCAGSEQKIIDYTVECLLSSMDNIRSVDFDDMIFLPYALKLQMQRSPFLVVDELQDLNHVQQWIALKSGERILAVGDPNQAIYQFRGADIQGMDNFHQGLHEQSGRNIITMPLTYSRRCSQSVIRAAQQVVPRINALPSAPEGSCVVCAPNSWQSAAVGDMILCRTNAPLIDSGYKLLKAGRPACIIGREITAGIVNLLGRAAKQCGSSPSLSVVLDKAADLTCIEVLQHSAKKHFARANAAQDRLDCLIAATLQCTTVREVVGKLQQLTEADPAQSIRLSTIHRAKGLEADRVYLLRPELLPHPMACSDYQLQSEKNLLYVAITRARRDLVFCGSAPAGINIDRK